MRRKKIVSLAVAMFVLMSSCCCCFSRGGDWDDWDDWDDWGMQFLPSLLAEVSVYVATLPVMMLVGP
jgi:hypothetical protein